MIGFINGYLVVKTGIPSFLVTLGTFFMLRGLNLAITKQVTGNVGTDDVQNMDGFASAQKVFASSFTVGGRRRSGSPCSGGSCSSSSATWVLLRTHLGNWIFAIGGSAHQRRARSASRSNKVKIGLFMAVGVMAWFTGMHILFEFNTVQSGIGLGNEFIYIVAAVVGGCLLTGGYGSVIGAAIGAFIFGMTNQGIVYAGWNPDWFFFFLGALLLGAILLNSWVRRTGGGNGDDHHTDCRHRAGTAAPLVRLTDAGKHYGNIIALQGVTLEVGAARSPASSGDNGAGKSTLIKIIAGLHQHTEGTYEVEGETVQFSSPREALDHGIATVYQDLAVVPLMPVWRNFFLGNEVHKGSVRCGDGHRVHAEDHQEGAARHGHRPARRRPAHRHAVRRRAAVRGHRPRRLLRSEGADPRRADRRARRQAVRRGAASTSCRPGSAGSASSSSPTTRTTPTRSATASCCSSAAGASATTARTRSPATELTALMAGGAELEELSHELEQGGGAAAAAAHELEEEVHELGIDRGATGHGRDGRAGCRSAAARTPGGSGSPTTRGRPPGSASSTSSPASATSGWSWARTATCRPTRPGSPTSWSGAGCRSPAAPCTARAACTGPATGRRSWRRPARWPR